MERYLFTAADSSRRINHFLTKTAEETVATAGTRSDMVRRLVCSAPASTSATTSGGAGPLLLLRGSCRGFPAAAPPSHCIRMPQLEKSIVTTRRIVVVVSPFNAGRDSKRAQWDITASRWAEDSR